MKFSHSSDDNDRKKAGQKQDAADHSSSRRVHKLNLDEEEDYRRIQENLNRLDDDVFDGEEADSSGDDFIPGQEEPISFDFTESDVERFRRINQEEYETRVERRREREKTHAARFGGKKKELSGQSGSGTQEQAGRRQERAASAEDPGKRKRRAPQVRRQEAAGDKRRPQQGGVSADTIFISRANKSATNKEIRRVAAVMLVLLLSVIGYFFYFSIAQRRSVVNNVHNARLQKLADKVVRGSIYSADGQILAQTTVNEDGTTSRTYPYGAAFAHVVGTSDINKSGIELNNDYDLISTDLDPLQKSLNEFKGVRSPGSSVTTSLNSVLQQAAYDQLGDRDGAIIALVPSTGETLAMVSKPDYDPNHLADIYNDLLADKDSKVLLNQATQGLFTPGSIFKIATTLAYLRSGADPDSYSYDCDGAISLQSDSGDSYIRCYGGEVHGEEDLTASFANSCNASFANIGVNLTVEQLTDASESLLFNKPLPTAFTTSQSRFSLNSSDSDWQRGATAIGQGDTMISPLHAAMIAAAIANDGVMMKPYVTDHVTGSKGETLYQTKPSEYGRVMSSSEAEKIGDMMEAVVSEGTAWRLSGRSYSCAGKTGTAEVAGRGNNAWFIGYAPAEDPQIAICVLVEDTGTASSETVPIAGALFDTYFSLKSTN